MTLGFNKTGNAYNHLKFKHACSQKDSPQPTPHAEQLSRLRYATLPSMDKSYGPLTVYPTSRCCLCASGRSRLDAPVIWRKLLPADSASCRLSSAMVSWIISRLVV